MTIAMHALPLLDRMGSARHDPARLAALWSAESTRVLVVDEQGRVAVDGGRLVGEPARGVHDPSCHVLLGRAGGSAGTVWFCRRGEVSEGVTLRELDVHSDEVELVMAATAVLAWHDHARFCERCGAPTVPAAGGFQRECTGCGRPVFPRTDPAMIVAVLDADDRLLLAHQAAWPEGRVSVLAGFVEAGEPAEHTVVREVAEESGLLVSEVRYLASQPWPYPRSLMLAFVARAAGEIAVDGDEIAWARWYSPADLTAAEAEGLTLPGKGSVAGRMIDAWRRGDLV